MALADENGEQGRHVVTENPDGRGPFVVLCDHASNRFPAAYDGLGLGETKRCDDQNQYQEQTKSTTHLKPS